MIRVVAWGLGALVLPIFLFASCFFQHSMLTPHVCCLDRSHYYSFDQKIVGENLSDHNVQVLLPHQTAFSWYEYFVTRMLVSWVRLKCVGRSHYSISLCCSVLGWTSKYGDMSRAPWLVSLTTRYLCLTSHSLLPCWQIDVPFLSEDVALFGYAFDYVPTNFVKWVFWWLSNIAFGWL